MSCTDLAIGPHMSYSGQTVTMPFIETTPRVTRIEHKAVLIAGIINYSAVSLPTDIGAKPALTPTAEPEDDPAGFYATLSETTDTDWNMACLLNGLHAHYLADPLLSPKLIVSDLHAQTSPMVGDYLWCTSEG
jgi:hypothetical protein